MSSEATIHTPRSPYEYPRQKSHSSENCDRGGRRGIYRRRLPECKPVADTLGVTDACKQIKLSACKTVQTESIRARQPHVQTAAGSDSTHTVREPFLGMNKNLNVNVKFWNWVKNIPTCRAQLSSPWSERKSKLNKAN